MAYTAKSVYEACLIEMNKVNAPSIILEDFNYLLNKALYQYINKKYNVYDINQQSTDDMRVLKATAILTPRKATDYIDYSDGSSSVVTDDPTLIDSLYGATYEVDLPDDYLHLLNCVCTFRVKKKYKCYDANTYVHFGAERLTADVWGQIINNFYMRPRYRRPYFYIHHVNVNNELPTNPIQVDAATGDIVKGTDFTPSDTYSFEVSPAQGINSSYGSSINQYDVLSSVKTVGNVSYDVDYDIKVEKGSDWIKIHQNDKTIELDPNNTSEVRDGLVTFTQKQSGNKRYIMVIQHKQPNTSLASQCYFGVTNIPTTQEQVEQGHLKTLLTDNESISINALYTNNIWVAVKTDAYKVSHWYDSWHQDMIANFESSNAYKKTVVGDYTIWSYSIQESQIKNTYDIILSRV